MSHHPADVMVRFHLAMALTWTALFAAAAAIGVWAGVDEEPSCICVRDTGVEP